MKFINLLENCGFQQKYNWRWVKRYANKNIKHLPALKIKSVLSGTEVFDWTVPKEWKIKKPILLLLKEKICDFSENNLHLVGYSIPFKGSSFDELKTPLYIT